MERKMGVILRCQLATCNESILKIAEFCQLYVCQILFELVCSWQSYRKNKKGDIFESVEVIYQDITVAFKIFYHMLIS